MTNPTFAFDFAVAGTTLKSDGYYNGQVLIKTWSKTKSNKLEALDGIVNSSSIDLGNASNTISGKATAKLQATKDINLVAAVGFVNLGAIISGNGEDTLIGVGNAQIKYTSVGLVNLSGSIGLINLGGLIDTGAGHDNILGSANAEIDHVSGSQLNVSIALGLVNTGTIKTCSGYDTVSGKAEAEVEQADGALANISTALGLVNFGLIDTGSGEDKIEGIGSASVESGFGESKITGTDIISSIKDTIFGVNNTVFSLLNGAIGVGILNAGNINTGDDVDNIKGKGIAILKNGGSVSLINAAIAAGVLNSGSIDLGSGTNKFVGEAVASSSQKQSFSFIDAGLAVGIKNANPLRLLDPKIPGAVITSVGTGTQTLEGTAKVTLTEVSICSDLPSSLVSGAAAVGIANGLDSTISLLNGKAIITGTATANADKVNSPLIGIGLAAGILNLGTITTGAGDDIISGIGFGSITNNNGLDLFAGIANFGLITTGDGNDTVDALTGGFFGTGTVDLGSGKDTLKGFGCGKFDGGGGDKDLITLNNTTKNSPITYDISLFDSITGYYHISLNGNSNGPIQDVKGFELITTSAGVENFCNFIGKSIQV